VTDRQTDGQTEFSSLDRVCIPCSAAKTEQIVYCKVYTVFFVIKSTLTLEQNLQYLHIDTGGGSCTPDLTEEITVAHRLPD